MTFLLKTKGSNVTRSLFWKIESSISQVFVFGIFFAVRLLWDGSQICYIFCQVQGLLKILEEHKLH